MNGMSEQLAQVIVKERSDNIQRMYEHRQLVSIAREGQQDGFGHWLRGVIQRVRGAGSSLPTVVETPEIPRCGEVEHLLYARIVKGNALAEIENRDRRLWQGKA